MKCESCKNRELIEDGTYYCPYFDSEIDEYAAIIECDGYKPYNSEVEI